MEQDPETDDLDGCDIEFPDTEATPDDGLPAAEGGVAVVDEGDDIDGCDLPFDDADATSDADLPVAEGGVA